MFCANQATLLPSLLLFVSASMIRLINFNQKHSRILFSSVPVIDVIGVAGEKVQLPCDVQPNDPHDAIFMVLWFKGDGGEPIYRLVNSTRSIADIRYHLRTSMTINLGPCLTSRGIRKTRN